MVDWSLRYQCIFFILFELNLRWKCYNFYFHSFRQSWPSSTAGVRPSTSRGTTTFCREDTQTHSRFAHSFSYLSNQCIYSLIRLHTIQPFAERTLKVRSYPFIHSSLIHSIIYTLKAQSYVPNHLVIHFYTIPLKHSQVSFICSVICPFFLSFIHSFTHFHTISLNTQSKIS